MSKLLQFELARLNSNGTPPVFNLVPVIISADDVSSVQQKENKLWCYIEGHHYPQDIIMSEIRTKAGGLFVVAGSFTFTIERIKEALAK